MMQEFFNTQTKLETLDRSGQGTGWVIPHPGPELCILLDHDRPSVGDERFVRLTSERISLSVIAEVDRLEGDLAFFKMPPHFEIVLPREPRKSQTVETAVLLSPHPMTPVQIADSSIGGLGFYAPIELDIADDIQISCVTRLGEVILHGYVVYANGTPGQHGYRHGLKILQLTDTQGNAWRTLHES